MRHEERQADKRPSAEQRVMHALNHATDGRLFRSQLRTITGLVEGELARVVKSLVKRGVVRTPDLVMVELVW